jgi:hypothetical protein
VAGVFEETLGAHRLGLDAHFFELGGHSLLATKAISRLRRVAGVDLPLRALFDTPVLRDLARVLAAAMRGGEPSVGRILRAERGSRAPVSFQQERMWFLDRFEPGGSTFNLAAAVRFGGELDVLSLERALAELARRHESLRTRFEAEDGRPVQIIRPPGSVDLASEDLSTAADPERRLFHRIEEEAVAPFDLASRPAWRVSLLRLGPRDHTLVIAMHHIVTDGWSMGVLVRELGALYEAYSKGQESPLAELPIQYGDYAVWQRAWLEGGELDRQLDYWRRQLEGVEPLDLPADRTRKAVQSHAGARLRGRIDPDLAEPLRTLARAEGATLPMLLLAAYALVLQRWSGQDDFAIGIPVANRTREETEGLIGFFVNTLAVRARFGPGEEKGLLPRPARTGP